MTDKKYRLVRDGTIRTYEGWIQDAMDTYAGRDRSLAKLNVDFMIEHKWLIKENHSE